MRYLDHIKTLPPDEADNPLILGSALHTGIEKGVEAGIQQYFSAFPIITDAHITEQIKLEYWIPRVRAMIAPESEFETQVGDSDFIGFIDMISPALGFHAAPIPDLYDLYDFKYAAKADRYRLSEQLHLYKYYFEKMNPGKKIRNLTYMVIPKISIKQKKDEPLQAFRARVEDELAKKEIQLVPVDYDPDMVIRYLLGVKHCAEAQDFPENPTYLCNFCEYQDYCKKGLDYMLLPENKRRNLNAVTKRVLWIYGAPFSGKTWFANEFPDPLMLNTDGNIKYVDAPYISIRDEVTMNGRMAVRKLGWEKLKETLDELEKKQNDFKTIVLDLLEDAYEQCRLYMYKQLGITHESDDSFRAWDKVRTEFLSTMKRLMGLNYENIILISHEDTSKDITRRDGKVTAIKPNIQDKIANKIAGMVDIVARVVADGDNRRISFKTDEVIFGGGRLTVKEREIPPTFEALAAIYDEANSNAAAAHVEENHAEEKANDKPDVNRVMGETPAENRRRMRKEEPAPAPDPDPIPERPKLDAEEALAQAVKQEEFAQAESKAMNETVNPASGEVTHGPEEKKPVPVRKRKPRNDEN